jgi:hypothetical protein
MIRTGGKDASVEKLVFISNPDREGNTIRTNGFDK